MIGGKKQILSDLQENIKQSNVCVIGVPAEEPKEKGTENIFEEKMKNSQIW